MSDMSRLKAKADELFDAEFIWYQSPVSPDDLAVGIDWDRQHIVIVDLDHPDGAVIQDAGLLYVNTVYVDDEDN